MLFVHIWLDKTSLPKWLLDSGAIGDK